MSKGTERKRSRKSPAELRYGVRTLDELEKLLQNVDVLRKRLKAHIELARSLGVSELRLDGVTKGDRALELLGGFVANVERPLRIEEYKSL